MVSGCLRVAIPHGENSNFAKQNRHERTELTLEDENEGSKEEMSLSRSRKVILPNKANVRSYSAEHPWVKVPPQEDIGMPE